MIVKILRWIGILPCSIVVLVLENATWKHTICAYIQENIAIFLPKSWGKILMYVLSEAVGNGLGGYCFVLCAYMATKYQQVVGAILTIIICSVGAISLFIVNVITLQYYTNIGIIATMVGAISACIYILIHNKNEIEY